MAQLSERILRRKLIVPEFALADREPAHVRLRTETHVSHDLGPSPPTPDFVRGTERAPEFDHVARYALYAKPRRCRRHSCVHTPQTEYPYNNTESKS